MRDYVNQRSRQEEESFVKRNKSEEKVYFLIFFCFGTLCILQVVLNLSLRLTFYSHNNSNFSNCNTTQPRDESPWEEADCEQVQPGQHRKLVEKCIALTRDRSTLEKRNHELLNVIKGVEEERDDLKLKLNEYTSLSLPSKTSSLTQPSELSGCVSSQRCPPGWREINAKCYFLSTESKRWSESRQECRNKGADLVIVNNEQEQNALYLLDWDQHLWIGLRRTDGIFKWVDGTKVKNTFWLSGQPDSGGPNNIVEDCVEMHHQNPALASWNDASCDLERRSMCEKDLCLNV